MSLPALVMTFGLEMELLLKPKPALYPKLKGHGFNPAIQPTHTNQNQAAAKRNQNAVRRTLAETLTDISITTKSEGSDYTVWTVKEETSLSEVADARGGGYWAVELVSPILNTEDMNWRHVLKTIFKIVHEGHDILLTKGCSMHIHVAPKPTWTVPDVHGLLRAVGVFDDAVMKIMPKDRKANEWSRSSFRDFTGTPATTGDKKAPVTEAYLPLKTAFDGVEKDGWEPLFDYIDTKVKMKGSAPHAMGGVRTVSMNFTPLLTCGIVEFRRPPGVKTTEDAEKWAAFAVAFAAAAFEPGWESSWVTRRRHANVAELQKFIEKGLQRVGWSQHNVVDPRVFIENTSQKEPPAYDHVEEIKRKLAKAAQEGGFEGKVIRSRQNSPASSNPSSPARSSRPTTPVNAHPTPTHGSPGTPVKTKKLAPTTAASGSASVKPKPSTAAAASPPPKKTAAGGLKKTQGGSDQKITLTHQPKRTGA